MGRGGGEVPFREEAPVVPDVVPSMYHVDHMQDDVGDAATLRVGEVPLVVALQVQYFGLEQCQVWLCFHVVNVARCRLQDPKKVEQPVN